MTVYPYTWRDPADCYPPRDVLTALGAPLSVRQARVIVFAESQRAAFGALARVGMAPAAPRALGVTHGLDARAITALGGERPGRVYVQHNGSIGYVEMTCGGREVHRFPLGPASESEESNVTDVMVDAVFEHLDQFGVQIDQIGYDDMRDAIEAALREHRAESAPTESNCTDRATQMSESAMNDQAGLTALRVVVKKLRTEHSHCTACPWPVMWDEDVTLLYRTLLNAGCSITAGEKPIELHERSNKEREIGHDDE